MLKKSGRVQSVSQNYTYNDDYLDEIIGESEPFPKLMPSEKAQVESDGEDANVFLVEKILDRKKVGRKTLYFVKWENYDESQNTWEPASNL